MDVPKKDETCPVCGYEFPRQKKSTIIAAWIMVILLLLYLVF